MKSKVFLEYEEKVKEYDKKHKEFILNTAKLREDINIFEAEIQSKVINKFQYLLEGMQPSYFNVFLNHKKEMLEISCESFGKYEHPPYDYFEVPFSEIEDLFKDETEAQTIEKFRVSLY